jgi:hypothetical protein
VYLNRNAILSLEAKIYEEIKIKSIIDIVTLQNCQVRGKHIFIIDLVLKQIITRALYFTSCQNAG